jgi:hypothetical protein
MNFTEFKQKLKQVSGVPEIWLHFWCSKDNGKRQTHQCGFQLPCDLGTLGHLALETSRPAVPPDVQFTPLTGAHILKEIWSEEALQ